MNTQIYNKNSGKSKPLHTMYFTRYTADNSDMTNKALKPNASAIIMGCQCLV